MDVVRLGIQFTSEQKAAVMRVCQVLLLAFVLVPLAATQRLPASFSQRVDRMTVEIDGVNFGAFSPVKSVETLVKNSETVGSGLERVVLSRDFVTDPSLYSWAHSLMQAKTGLKKVTLISENADGVEIARYELHNAQPVSWAVETSDPEIGGLHEKVEFAVQKVTRR